MNIAYFRNSTLAAGEVIERLKKEAAAKGITIIGETILPQDGGTMITLCKPEWVQKIIAQDKKLIGLIPCSVLVHQEGEGSAIGIGNPQLVGSVAHVHEIEDMLADMDKELRVLVDVAADAAPLKPTGVKLYSTATCPYCKMEKSYLEEKKVAFDLVMVDADQQAAEEMVRKTGQMGVPVTEIQFEGGESEFIVGFDKAHLNELLGITE